MTDKKIFIGVLLIVMLLFSVAFASESSVQSIVEGKIDIPESYTVTNSAVADGNTSKFWWRTPADAENGGEISVTADENGNILSYYHFKNDYVSKDEGAHFSVYNKSDSRFFALRFIERVCPELADNVEYNAASLSSDISKNMKTASVSFYRVENNIPYYDNGMDFVIDLNTAQVVQYNLKWDFDAVFPDLSEVISQTEAMMQYNSRIGIGLQYRVRKEDGKNKAYLVYCSNDEDLLIDAISGKILTDELMANQDSYFDSYNDGYDVEGVTIAEQDIDPSVRLNIPQAEEYARTISEIGITDEYSLSYSSYERINGTYCVNLEFSKLPTISFEEMTEEEKFMYLAGDYSYIRLKIDMQTKDIMSLRIYDKNAVVNPAPEATARWEVERFLKNYLPLKYDNCRFSESKSGIKDGIYKLVYTCYVSDVSFEGNSIVVEYDTVTNTFISLDCKWLYEVDFVTADNIVDIDEAKETLFAKVPLQLTYVNTTGGIKAVYMLYPYYPAVIGADDGILKNTDGSDYKIRKYDSYIDIEGHYAQGMIMRLNNNLIINSDKERHFQPDANISQKDFLTWIITALTGTTYENESELYNYLTVNQIIRSEEIYPEAELLKEDAIVFFIRALGYDTIAQAEDIYRLSFADSHIVTPSKTGYIALAKGIGMISGDENNCVKPKTPLTRSDACCMIYKYLAR